ncbi:MAG TPA: hypothetical protein PK951_05265 [Chitinophagaceae bacterium]|nr:hypothetical protein [Chitinophagaceae bacterium]
MKRLSYILLCYLLLLSVFPCCTIDECPNDKAIAEQAANHENGDEDCGTCSPFFNCEGCASVPVTVEQVSIRIDALPVQQVYTGFLSPSIPEVSYGFWHPPKIG